MTASDPERGDQAATRIDFYHLEDASRGDRLQFACRLIEKIRSQGLRVLVHCPDVAQARAIDRLLWTFRDGSFLPHGLVGQVDAELTPVLISPNGEPALDNQVLINLAPEAPSFYARFQRVCELVDQRPGVLAAGRRRWSWYKRQPCELKHHRIGAPAKPASERLPEPPPEPPLEPPLGD